MMVMEGGRVGEHRHGTPLASCSGMKKEADQVVRTGLAMLNPIAGRNKRRAVIEVPGGTMTKRSYDPAKGTFPIHRRNGRAEKLAYLPYPCNYGFIPGTRWTKSDGGDGDPVDVFVICDSLPTGTMLTVELIGVIEIMDSGERNDKLIALPADPTLKPFRAAAMRDLPKGVRKMLKQFILHHNPADAVRLVAVRGPRAARRLVNEYRVRKN